MSLTAVEVTSEVWMMCVTHALSTEKEEIMGLLLGDVLVTEDGRATARIFSAAPQTRSDRRKDRVETNPEQLAAAAAEAERLSVLSGRETRVIGWYHSHPHITVLPSHVDVATQGMYQMLDQGFIGLIFSCFGEDANKVGRIQATAFQSAPANRRSPTPVPARPSYSRSPSPLPATASIAPNFPPLGGEQNVGVRAASPGVPAGPAQSDSSVEEVHPTAPVLREVNPTAGSGPSRIRGGGPSDTDEQDPSGSRRPPRPPSLEVEPPGSSNRSVRNSPSPYYPSDSQTKGWSYAQAAGPVRRESSQDSMASAMEEAAMRSMEDNRGAHFVHKEVPLRVISGLDVVGSSPELLLDPLVSLQRILFAEEKAAYRQAIAQSSVAGRMHPIAAIHHSATYQASLCKLLEYCLSPVLAALWERQHQCELQLAFLEQEERDLRENAAANPSPSKLTRPVSVRTVRPGEPGTSAQAASASERRGDLLGDISGLVSRGRTSEERKGRSGAESGLAESGLAGQRLAESASAKPGFAERRLAEPGLAKPGLAEPEGLRAGRLQIDVEGEGVVGRTREARAGKSGTVVEGQEKEKPMIEWE